MGRIAYKVKNTFVEFGAPGEDFGYHGGCQHTWSSDLISQEIQGLPQQYQQAFISEMEAQPMMMRAEEEWIPATPSPMLHPAVLPAGVNEEMLSFCVDSTLPPTAFDSAEGYQDMQEMCIPAMAYDPSSGWCSGWCMPMPGHGDYNSMSCQEMGDMQQWEYMGDGLEHGELQERLLAQLCDASPQEELQGELQDVEGGAMGEDGHLAEEACLDALPADPEGSAGSDERLEEDMSGRSGASRGWSKVSHKQPGTYTTVMLRNVPNKYTREMLVEQLNRDFKGRFDFVYLPIDFKNGCNIGYGFINFRTVQACAEFVSAFDGVDVSRCLPGLHSRKVAEVTPARVQGLEENVRRLRSSPVMCELARHPEWMPLLLGEDGEEQPFPQPEQPVPPVRSRRSREGERGDRGEAGGSGRARGSWRR